MKNTYEKLLGLLFAADAEADPTERLCSRVMHKIERKELGRMRRLTLGFGLVVIAAIVAFIPAVNYVAGAVAASGLGQYISLIVVDGSQVMAHWQELALSIVESLPWGGLSIIVALLIVALASLKRFASYQQSLASYQHRLFAETA